MKALQNFVKSVTSGVRSQIYRSALFNISIESIEIKKSFQGLWSKRI